jgi:hypothetical protein
VSYRTNLTYLLRGGRYDVDQPPLDEQERVDLVRDYHRRAPIRLPNEKLHAILHVIVVEANSRSEMKRWRIDACEEADRGGAETSGTNAPCPVRAREGLVREFGAVAMLTPSDPVRRCA